MLYSRLLSLKKLLFGSIKELFKMRIHVIFEFLIFKKLPLRFTLLNKLTHQYLAGVWQYPCTCAVDRKHKIQHGLQRRVL